jgi:hypothetical protein
MTCTLKGRFFFVYDKKKQKNTVKFLNDRGIITRMDKDGSLPEGDALYIELKEMPIVLQKLKNTAYYDNMDELNLNIFQVDIHEITELGVLLYVAHNYGDNQIFIPMNQVICFHDFEKDHFKKINFQTQNDESIKLKKK